MNCINVRCISGIICLFLAGTLCNKIISNVEANSQILIKHSEKLAHHDTQINAIFDGKFTPRFLNIIKRDINEQK